MKNKQYMINRWLCLGLVMLLTVMMFISPINGISYYTEGGFKYTINGESISIHSYFGTDTTANIPEMIAELPVTEIEDDAFLGCNNVKEIKLPYTIQKVGKKSFIGAKSLQKLINQSPNIDPTVSKDVIIVNDLPRYAPVEATDGSSSDNGESTSEDKKIDTNGIKRDDGSIVTVDTEKNLISIDSKGHVEVLDDKNQYTLGHTGGGEPVILNEKGKRVEIDESGVKNKETINSKTVLLSAILFLSIVMIVFLMFKHHRQSKNA